MEKYEFKRNIEPFLDRISLEGELHLLLLGNTKKGKLGHFGQAKLLLSPGLSLHEVLLHGLLKLFQGACLVRLPWHGWKLS